MYELEPELEGDLDWALFPAPEREATLSEQIFTRLKAALLIGACWFVTPALGIAAACAAVLLGDVRTARRLARTIPDPAGARICSWFSYAWGCWKLGMTALATLFLMAILMGKKEGEPPPGSPEMLGIMTAALLFLGGFLASAGLTAAGIVAALRSGMRVWIGEGVNRARTLLLAMLMVALTCFVLVPWMLALGTISPKAVGVDRPGQEWLFLLGFFGILFGAPVGVLLILDMLCRQVVAARPGKFGPKVPSVGKWNT